MGSQGNLAGSGMGLSAHLNGENGGCAEESPGDNGAWLWVLPQTQSRSNFALEHYHLRAKRPLKLSSFFFFFLTTVL